MFMLLAMVAFAASPAAAQDFQVPIDCALDGPCAVQDFVDVDPGPGAQDPMCGTFTYNEHEGIDFRAPATLARRGVNVLAPAAGVVARVRNGEPEGVFLREGRAALAGRDCGNGVRIVHEGGWSTQLCHMRAGSLRVREGERVSPGQPLGLVGLSGRTTFPHVHISMWRGEARVDPLTGAPIASLHCGAQAATPGPHWSAAARAALAYPNTRWFALGFSGDIPASGARFEDLAANAATHAPALIFWALAIGPHTGDVLHLRVFGPDSALVAESTRTLPSGQPQASQFAGRRTPPNGWPAGQYRGEAQLVRDGRVVATRTEALSLR
jgi:hypothetical protein